MGRWAGDSGLSPSTRLCQAFAWVVTSPAVEHRDAIKDAEPYRPEEAETGQSLAAVLQKATGWGQCSSEVPLRAALAGGASPGVSTAPSLSGSPNLSLPPKPLCRSCASHPEIPSGNQPPTQELKLYFDIYSTYLMGFMASLKDQDTVFIICEQN